MLKDFGGKMFNEIADTADDIYNTMDPPTPSLAKTIAAPTIAAPTTAADFAAKMNNNNDNKSNSSYGYYGGGGCFSGNNTIIMANGTVKLVKNLVKGDRIATPSGKGAAIRCVVRTSTFEGKTDMCLLNGGLTITPGHPVKLQGEWVYPRDIVNRQLVNIDAFYNLVVDQDHIAIVNGVELILLGHGYTDGILKHSYLGTQRVIDDLKTQPGYDEGLVQLQQKREAQQNEMKMPKTRIQVNEIAA